MIATKVSSLHPWRNEEQVALERVFVYNSATDILSCFGFRGPLVRNWPILREGSADKKRDSHFSLQLLTMIFVFLATSVYLNVWQTRSWSLVERKERTLWTHWTIIEHKMSNRGDKQKEVSYCFIFNRKEAKTRNNMYKTAPQLKGSLVLI